MGLWTVERVHGTVNQGLSSIEESAAATTAFNDVLRYAKDTVRDEWNAAHDYEHERQWAAEYTEQDFAFVNSSSSVAEVVRAHVPRWQFV